MSRRFGAACVIWLSVALASAAASPDASSLAKESIDRFDRAEQAKDGWKELYDEGVALAEQAIERDPNATDAHYALFLNLGRRSERSGVGAQIFTVRRLKKLLDRTIELDPQHAHAWEARGEMLLALPRLLGGSRSEGEAALRRAAEIDPEWPKPWLRLAALFRDEDEPEQARALAEHAKTLACSATTVATPAKNCVAAESLLRELSIR